MPNSEGYIWPHQEELCTITKIHEAGKQCTGGRIGERDRQDGEWIYGEIIDDVDKRDWEYGGTMTQQSGIRGFNSWI